MGLLNPDETLPVPPFGQAQQESSPNQDTDAQ
jgi:hypothetical protein